MDRLDRDAEGITNVEAPHDETHATTGGAAAAGAVTGGVIGLTGGPIGAAIGAVGGAIVGAAAERMMHSDDDAREVTDTEASSSVYTSETRDTTIPTTDVTTGPSGLSSSTERQENASTERGAP